MYLRAKLKLLLAAVIHFGFLRHTMQKKKTGRAVAVIARPIADPTGLDKMGKQTRKMHTTKNVMGNAKLACKSNNYVINSLFLNDLLKLNYKNH